MYQVHGGAHVSLLVPEKTDYTACHPKKTTTYKLQEVTITTHTQVRRKSIGREKKKKKKGEKRRKGKKRQEKQKDTTQEEKAREGKDKNVILTDHRH